MLQDLNAGGSIGFELHTTVKTPPAVAAVFTCEIHKYIVV